MRKLFASTVSLLLLASLTACSGSANNSTANSASESGCTRLAEGGSAVDSIEVTGKVFEAPVVKFKSPLNADKTQTKVLSGDSTELVGPTDTVTVDFSFFNAETGDQITASPYDGQQYATIPLADEALPGLQAALACAPVGSRLSAVIVGDTALNQIFSLDASVAVVAILDIKESKKVTPANTTPAAGEKMPTVTEGKAGVPSIKVPKADPPAETRVVVEKQGDGEVVKASDTVEVNYLGVLWSNGEKFDSSWDRGQTAEFPLNGVVAGFKKGLQGQKVGSRVTIVVTPQDGYGEQATASIPANSYLVFVVDIISIK